MIAGMGGDSVASSNVNRSADALLIYIEVLLMMKSAWLKITQREPS
jgi:hypothetical protein